MSDDAAAAQGPDQQHDEQHENDRSNTDVHDGLQSAVNRRSNACPPRVELKRFASADRWAARGPGTGGRTGAAHYSARGEPPYSLNFVPGSSVDCPVFGPLVIAHWNAVTGSFALTILAAAPVEDFTEPVIFTRVS